MYSMKNIITHDQDIPLPTCMYQVRKLQGALQDGNLLIDNQVTKLYKKSCDRYNELNHKQEQLLKKIEMLYERIKDISSICRPNKDTSVMSEEKCSNVPVPAEIVLVSNPDMLPWFLNIFLNKLPISLDIHLHSSVLKNERKNVEEFMKNQQKKSKESNVNVKLIITNGDPELRLTSQVIPIVGNVNILRYFSLLYPKVLPYDQNDYVVDSLLDLCYILERMPDQNKVQIWEKITSHSKKWIYNDNVSIVDIAAYNVIKNLQNRPKYVSKDWYDKCDNMCAIY